MRFLAACLSLCAFLALASSPSSAASVSYTYDGRGRLVQVTYSTGEKIVYTYDAAGNRVTQTVTKPGQ